MSKPEDIPQDVWDAAQKTEQACMDSTMHTAASEGRHACETIIARAIMAERDRCALLAFAAYERNTELRSKIVRRIRSGQAVVR
jgi:hypothetical protein